MKKTEEQCEEARREYEEKLKAYAKKVVAAAPPLTPAQADRVAILLLGGERPIGPYTPTAYEIEQQRLENERAAAIAEAKALAEAVMACDVCNKPPGAHFGPDHHKWVAGRAAKVIQQRS